MSCALRQELFISIIYHMLGGEKLVNELFPNKRSKKRDSVIP